jgi:hypothetical protein
MNAQSRQYLFGLIFLAFGIYQATLTEYVEFALYSGAGMAFIFNALVNESRLQEYRKLLIMITWGLIISTGVLFLYLLRYKFF